MTVQKMYVVKRAGQREPVSFDKILARIVRLSDGLDVDPAVVAQKVINYVHSGVSTEELDRLAAETAAYMGADMPDYSTLASRVLVSNLHKQTKENYSDVVAQLSYVTTHGRAVQLLSDEFISAATTHAGAIQAALDYSRDYNFDYFGFKTLERSYLLRVNGRVVERPQHMYMRIALGIQLSKQGPIDIDVPELVRTYNMLSAHMYTHASPTMFNAGTKTPQLASCFLLPVDDDSIVGIYDTLKKCAVISKNAGGIGVSAHNVRGNGSFIAGTSGTSNGLTPMLKVFNDTARYVDQCFPGSTHVYGSEKMQRLDAISVNDWVLTSDSVYKQVDKPLRHDNVEDLLCSIFLYGASQSLQVTQKHPLMVVQRSPNPIASLKMGTRCTEYLECTDIQKGDFMVFGVPQGQRADVSNDVISFLGACTQGRLHDGVALFQVRQPTAALELATMAQALNLQVDYEMDTESNTLSVRVSLSEHLQSLTLSSMDESQHFAYLTGMLRVCSLKSMPVVLLVNIATNDMARKIQYHALHSGHVSFVSNNDSTTTQSEPEALKEVRIVWSNDLKGWWKGFTYDKNIDLCEMIIADRVYRWGNKLLVPILDINTSETPVQVTNSLYDMELVSDPHDYNTEYGIVHNGGGKRKGAIAVYLEPWHPDVMEFLELKKNTGKDEIRARDLFYAMWIPDLFMRRVRDDGKWSLFCPSQIEPVKLHELHSHEFDKAYEALEAEGKAQSVVSARAVWTKILESQMETGTPYMLFKDACNAKSNQQNLGTIKSSNLCTEIIEYSSKDEIAVCNLASIALPKFVRDDGTFDYKSLMELVALVTRNLNHVIDASLYPLPEMKTSNLSHRPMGLGVQGLANVFFKMGVPFTSPAARDVNRRIFKCIYYAAVRESVECAKKCGPYESFHGSPASRGRLQPDLWGVDPEEQDTDLKLDWRALRNAVVKHGMRNSLLVAPMPTASTAQIMGNVECFEPQTSNMYTRMVLSGNFIVVNKYLVDELSKRDLWNESVRDQIIAADGSVQGLDIPDSVKEVYRTVWEIKQKDVVDMAIDRAPYIDQSQSLNIHIPQPTHAILNGLHFHTWKNGLKTGMYYLRSRPAATPIKASLGSKSQARAGPEVLKGLQSVVCTDEVCTMCSS